MGVSIDLPPLSYDVLLVDPPWAFRLYSEKGEKKAAQAHYACIATDELAKFPVGQLAAPDCLLMMWATWPMLPEAIDLMKAWGFTYKTGGAWSKRTTNGKPSFGPGYILRSSTEPFLIGTIGRPKIHSHSVRGYIEAEAREHSRKPDEQYDMMEKLCGPNARRCELFARTVRSGWSAWGNETSKFAEVAE